MPCNECCRERNALFIVCGGVCGRGASQCCLEVATPDTTASAPARRADRWAMGAWPAPRPLPSGPVSARRQGLAAVWGGSLRRLARRVRRVRRVFCMSLTISPPTPPSEGGRRDPAGDRCRCITLQSQWRHGVTEDRPAAKAAASMTGKFGRNLYTRA